MRRNRRNGFIVVAVGSIALVGIAVLWARGRATPIRDIQRAIEAKVQPASEASFVSKDDAGGGVQDELRAFYEERGFAPVWVDGKGPNPRARALVESIRQGSREIAYEDYDLKPLELSLAEAGKRPGLFPPPAPASRLADLDLTLSRTFLVYAHHALNGRVPQAAMDPEWHTSARDVDVVEVLKTAAESGKVDDALKGLEPDQAAYRRLQEALARYTLIAESGGWPQVQFQVPAAAGKTKRGVTADAASLWARLEVTEDLPKGAADIGNAVEGAVTGADTNQILAEGLARFKSRHGLEPTGHLDKETAEALNVPVEARLRQIRLNLERWRWLPRDLGERYIAVNIPDYRLDLIEADRSVMTMRVVVGKKFNATPVFSDKVTRIEFNPYWTVPNGIAAEEVVPAIRKDRGYLSEKGIRLVSRREDGEVEEINPRSIKWAKVDAAHLPFLLRQDPGPLNPLGRIKFVCPNEYDVYLHDTPEGHLFEVTERDFSHGCIRLERPLDLAEYLLHDDPEWPREEILAAIESGENKGVPVPRPIPLHVLYWTAWVDDDSSVQFRSDIYGLDERLDQALESGRTAKFEVNRVEAATAASDGS